jgi:predicted AAA+ superfamily ATPase
MFFKDLLERFNITNIQLLEALKEGLFSSFSSKFSLTAFYKNYKDKFPFSKDSLFSYYKYFQESMLIFETRVFAGSVYKRLRNLPKIYLVDTGLARRVKTVDYGRLLENAVFLELRRGGYEIHHFEENGGCDFIAKREDSIKAIQVTWELGENNREREIQGLIQSCKSLGVKEGLTITYDQDEIFDQDNIKIEMLPFWKWVSRRDAMTMG